MNASSWIFVAALLVVLFSIYVLLVNGIPQRFFRRLLKPGGPSTEPLLLCAPGHDFQRLTDELKQCSRCGYMVVSKNNGPYGLAEYLRAVQTAPMVNKDLPLHHYRPAVPVSGPNAEAVLCELCGLLESEGLHQIPKPEHAPGIPPEAIPADHTTGFWYEYEDNRVVHRRRITFRNAEDAEDWRIMTAAKWPSLTLLETIGPWEHECPKS